MESYQTLLVPEPPRNKIRNLTGFWLLGLCNNYAYVIMLSAAHDILGTNFSNNTGTSITPSNNSSKDCNSLSSGSILLADILPGLFVKSVAPFIGISTSIRIILVVALCGASFALVAFSYVQWMAFFGVIAASLSSGLGETTLLSYASYFDKNVISAWSSGTGGSGIFGALSYAGMTQFLKLSPRHTLLIMLFIPVVMIISYYFVLIHPKMDVTPESGLAPLLDENSTQTNTESLGEPTQGIKSKMKLIKILWPYALPLMAVYFAEYFINQGLTELIYFKDIWINHDEQYRWFQVDYQLGVFISRSSVNLFTINALWILPVLQFANLVVFLIEVQTRFLPSIWLVFILILFEGLLGGAAYVNTYYKMRQKIPAEKLKFSMAVVPLADTLGIAIAGAIALPVHMFFCNQ
uniref:Battenin n=1 Tax=Strigamia maritima TaxID=126957 RepID=T1JBF2_STRMM